APAHRPGAAPDPGATGEGAVTAPARLPWRTWHAHRQDEPAPTTEEPEERTSDAPTLEPGPLTAEEIPTWARQQRARMQAELQDQMAARMGPQGLGDARFEALMEAAFAQRDALDAEEGLDDSQVSLGVRH
ncbi:MAG: hypothetical protein ABIO70_13925, partial [Pseudomonadota bacterium]